MPKYVDLSEGFRAGMRRLASGVSVVSLRDEQGNRFALTATSVTSVSDNPASLLVCVNTSASSFPSLQAGANFCVNVLSAKHENISNHCAGLADGEDRFKVGHWADDNNMPYLVDAEANFFCENDVVYNYGTHLIVIGKMIDVSTANGAVKPLVYVDGGYKVF